MSNVTTRLTTQAGVKRDGTRLDSNYYADAQWCRFALGKPKKMGGYRKINTFTGPILGLHIYSKQNNEVLTSFSLTKIEAALMDQFGNGAPPYNRTPTSFVTHTDYAWTFDHAYDMTGSGKSMLYAHAGRNGTYIDNNIPTAVFYGEATDTAVLAPIVLTDVDLPATTGGITVNLFALTLASATGFAVGDMIRIIGAGAGGVDLYTDITVLAGVNATVRDAAGTTVVAAAVAHILGTDGGIVTIGPYLFYYGSNGLIANTDVNVPTLVKTGDANKANPIGTKIVMGLPIRGGSQSPAALFWSLDSVIRVAYVGGTLLWQYDVITSQSSILSADSIIENDGIYYWLGQDRALMFNGAVRELPNLFNNQWFYDNLNHTYKNKVWATKIPRYGEIWWFFPKGTSTVCNWAIIYNIRENSWYDTPISRSSGAFVQTFSNPVWGDESGNAWQHEHNLDAVNVDVATAIKSYFTSHDIGYPTGGAIQEAPQGQNAWTRIERVEPDFNQVGDMSVDVQSREYANSTPVYYSPMTFSPTDERVDMRVQGRSINVTFTSNALGGDYWMGIPLLHLDIGDRRE